MTPSRIEEKKPDQIIWWLMVTAFSILILGGAAWATNINNKVEKIAGIEINLQYIRDDILSIKDMIRVELKNQ